MSLQILPRDFLTQIAEEYNLTPKEEKLLILRFGFEGKSYEEIARQLSLASQGSCLNLMTKIYAKFSIGVGSDTRGKEEQLRTFLVDQFQSGRFHQELDELKQRTKLVEPELERLCQIRDQFREEIQTTRDHQANAITNSFRTHIFNLSETFESDFLPYQPHVNFLALPPWGKQQEFQESFKQEFSKYLDDKLSSWNLTAEQELRQAFSHLADSALHYAELYQHVTAKTDDEKSSKWSQWASRDPDELLIDVAAIVVTRIEAFSRQSNLLNTITARSVNLALVATSVAILGPLGIMTGIGASAWQANRVIKELKQELKKSLFQVAEEQSKFIHQTVKEYFDAYEAKVIELIDDDIQSWKLLN